MITTFDDYMIHQTTEPVAQPMTGERNFYDRYWFNGFDQSGGFIFEIGFGLYPNRHIMDGHFSVCIDGKQHAFHGSRRAPVDRSDSVIGPFSIEIVKPMRTLRVVLAPNDTGIEVDLTFNAISAPTQEPKNVMSEGVRQIMNTTRFTQAGRWQGKITIGGKTLNVDQSTTLGLRDKSWGYRPIGEPEAGAPGLLNSEPGVYWTWAPILFDGFMTHYGTFQDHDGNALQESGAIVPTYSSASDIPTGEDPGHRDMSSTLHKVDWKTGTRSPAKADIEFTSKEGDQYQMTLTPILQIYMLGIGYQHPEWGHGFWKGEEAFTSESWDLDDMDPLDYKNIHVHNVVSAVMTDNKGKEYKGVGTLETICFGRHTPSGFEDILDGAK